MLASMKYQVTFLSTGRTFSADVEFGAGVTAITGENESGKSLILEMIRWLMFGSGALRSAASNYRNLSGTLVFTVGDETYRVDRNPRLEALQKGGTVIATGKTAVNETIVRTLGFNLRVFDVACAANQGDIERLTMMRPADRKQMVDSVIGLNVLDGVEKWTREEAVRQRREAEAMGEGLVRPAEPTAPADVRPAAELQPALDAAEADYRTYITLQGIKAPVKPVLPEPPAVSGTIADLEAHQLERAGASAEVTRLRRVVGSIPDAQYTAQQLDAAEAWNEYSTELRRRGPEPVLTEDEIAAAWEMWQAHDSWSPSEPCPACGYQHTTAVRPPAPAHGKDFLRIQSIGLDRWSEPLEKLPPVDPDIISANIASGRRALASVDQKREAEAALAKIVVPEDRSADLALLRADETAKAVFAAQSLAYAAQLEAWTDAQSRLADLEGAAERFAVLRQQHTTFSVYEAQLRTFLDAEVAYDEALDRVTEKQRSADGLRKGAEALRLTRTRVKQHLIPSLSRVASGYLTSMTAGRRTSVVIDDDFNIIVDGQEIEELAGSAKAVVNLAVRLGLGQVLTQRMFPVFLGDEIDAAMDPTRAEAMTETLRGLTERIKQVIIVSHKAVDADHQISL